MTNQEEQAHQGITTEVDETNQNPEARKIDNSLLLNRRKNSPEFAIESLSLKTKVKALAIAFSIFPILGIGLGAYFYSNQSTERQIERDKQSHSTQLAKDIDRFLSSRYGDIQTLSQQPSFSDPQVIAVTPNPAKEKVFNDYLDAYGLYSRAAFLDLQGKPIVQGKGKILPNQADKDYFQTVLKTGKATISAPILSSVTDTFNINIAAPVKEKGTGKLLGIVMLQMPVDRLAGAIEQYTSNSDNYYLVEPTGKLFLSSHPDDINKQAKKLFSKYTELKEVGRTSSAFDEKNEENGDTKKVLLTYATIDNAAGVENLDLGVLLSSDTNIAFAAQNYLLTLIGWGTFATMLLAATVATYLADYATRPLFNAARAVNKLGQGQLDTRLEVVGGDEVAILSRNINSMADEIQKLLATSEETTQARAVADESRRKQEQNQVLQMGLLNFLDQVQEVANGDLTVRAQITEDDIGIVADFFNSIIENLRELVTQVKAVASEVNQSVAENEGAIAKLATNELEQAESIVQTLDLVEKMTDSIATVAGNAKTAANIARNASQNAASGVKAIEGTVISITELSETVEATVQKVKRLNDASGRISKVVRLIDEIAMKTKYLAVNAGIEASRAGEEARGFVVVAEQVGQLAASSASATKEIEQIVASIQQETAEVLGAMQEGNNKVQQGTQLVTKAKQSLSQIFDIAQQIDGLVQFISQATVSQTETSQIVKESMSAIAQTSTQNSVYSREVSQSLQYSVAIATRLKASVNNFKVKEQA
jgi:methyl-accepting chemotaxis protein PixJ